MSARRFFGLLLARPLIAIAIAAAVVGVILLLNTHRQTTPITHRTEHVGLSDQQQVKASAPAPQS